MTTTKTDELLDSTKITAEMVVDACLEIEATAADRATFQRRMRAVQSRVRIFAPELTLAVSGFASFGSDAATFKAIR